MRTKLLTILVGGIVAVAALICTLLIANRPQRVSIEASIAKESPDDGFAHSIFESLLQNHVMPKAMSISLPGTAIAWHRNHVDRDRLDGYLAAVSACSPDTTPARFP